ncbi:hypothetical protein E4U52_007509 [Claviceps spartinae]|nr:hypothetical protein E4U52_007509 [Claviceps spartinae]
MDLDEMDFDMMGVNEMDVDVMDVSEMDFDEMDFDMMDVNEMDFDMMDFVEMDFVEMDFVEMDFVEMDFVEMDFVEMDFVEMDFVEMDFVEMDFDMMDVVEMDFDEMDFDEMDFDEMDFDEMDVDVMDVSEMGIDNLLYSWKLSRRERNERVYELTAWESTVVGISNLANLLCFLAQTLLRQAARPAASVRTPLSLFQYRLLSSETRSAIDRAVASAPVVLFMKGTPEMPQCGFSATVIKILGMQGVNPTKFAAFNVLEDAELREGIKEYSDWPTIPQLYVDKEFVGGCDILRNMHTNGELATFFEGKDVLAIEEGEAKE